MTGTLAALLWVEALSSMPWHLFFPTMRIGTRSPSCLVILRGRKMAASEL